MDKRIIRLMAGAALTASVIVGAAPAEALGAAPGAVASIYPRYCTGLDAFSVHRLYRAYFLREPDAGGLAYWQDVLATGRASLGGIAQLFSQSAEFTNRYGTLSNRAFVQLVYRNVMNREGEQTGVDWWTGVLDRGHPRGAVMLGFSDSAEFKERTGIVPPVPAATDPQVLPETDPFTVRPGGELVAFTETETSRSSKYWYPLSVPMGEIFRYTGNQLICMGWDIRSNGMYADYVNEGQVIVSSKNNLVLTAMAFQQVISIDPVTFESELVNEIVVSVNFWGPGYPWRPGDPGF